MVLGNLSVCISIFENEIQSIQCQKYERNLSANSIGTFGALSPKSLITSPYVWWCDQSMDVTLGDYDYAAGLYFLQTIDFIVWVGVDLNGSNPTLQTLACLEVCIANNARIDRTLEHAHVSPPPPPPPQCAKTIMKSTSKLKQSANPILQAHAKLSDTYKVIGQTNHMCHKIKQHHTF